MPYHLGMQFSTLDADNDKWASGSCAVGYSSAWWYNDCGFTNLKGVYNGTTFYAGVNWYPWRRMDYSLRKAEMKMRPRKMCHKMKRMFSSRNPTILSALIDETWWPW